MSVAMPPRTRAEAARERRRAKSESATRSFNFTAAHAPAGAGRRRRRPPAQPSMPAPRRRARPKASRYERASLAERLLPSLPEVRPTWRMASLVIVILFGSLLFYVLSTPKFFVNSVNLAGATYVSAEEIYDASEINRMHIFWVRPEVIQANIEQVPGIASARVELAWPNQVTITVVERLPALIWRQGGQNMWVDGEGVMFPARADAPGLLPVAVDDAAEPLAEGQTVPVAAIAGALQLRQLRPNIELLHYDAHNGLSYQDGRGWRGTFGVGEDMEVKLAVYETLVASLVSRQIQPTLISVSNPDAPFYRTSPPPPPAQGDAESDGG